MRGRRIASGIAAFPVIGLIAGNAGAEQTPVFKLPEQVITATKRPQDPLKVDGTVAVAGPDDIFNRNRLSIDRLDRLFPDLNVRQRSARAYANFTIRGQSSVDFYNPTVQLLVDGLPQDQAFFIQLLPESLRQVELLYGPQGTLYGRNAVSGVLNVVTQMPSNRFIAVGTGGYGTIDKELRGWLSGPIVPNALYADVTASYLKEDGEYRRTDDDGFGDTFNGSVRARIRLAPKGGPMELTVIGSHAALKSSEEQYVTRANFGSRSVFETDSNYALYVNSIGAIASYKFDFGKLTSLTHYQKRRLDRTLFGSFTPEDQDTFSQEIRLASNPKDGNWLDYVVGGYFQSLDFERRAPASNQISKQTIKSFALFGEATWHVTKKLDVTAGLRLDYEIVGATASGAITLDESSSNFAPAPKFAIGYQITKNVRAYGLYSVGYKPGGFTRNVTPFNIAFDYDPQFSHNGEIGIKGKLFGGRLRFSASGYYTYTDDYQLFVGVLPNQYLQNAGTVVSKGVNLRFVAFPLDRLRITGGLGLNSTKFTDYDNPATPGVDFTGNRVPYAPPITGNLDIAYQIDLPKPFGTVTPYGGLNYVGKVYFDEGNTIGQDPYVLFNAGVVWDVNKHLKIKGYVDNITDKKYAVYGFDGGPFLGRLFQLGRGRNYGVRVTVKF